MQVRALPRRLGIPAEAAADGEDCEGDRRHTQELPPERKLRHVSTAHLLNCCVMFTLKESQILSPIGYYVSKIL